jgi:hypothetical protein
MSLSGIGSYSLAVIISNDVQKDTDGMDITWAILRQWLQFRFLPQDVLFGTYYIINEMRITTGEFRC